MSTSNVAHRGYSGVYPENTMRAFLEAVPAGAHGLECDVQLTSDGEPVIIHDERLERTSDGNGWVAATGWKEIAGLDAGSWFAPRFAGERIPHLDDLLDFLDSAPLTLNLELKNATVAYEGLEDRVIRAVRRRPSLNGRVLLSSFNHSSLVRLKEIDSNIPTGALYVARMHEPWHYAGTLAADALHPHYKYLDGYLMRGARRAGLAINTYTVNEVDDMRRVLELGADSIITNFPDRLAALIS